MGIMSAMGDFGSGRRAETTNSSVILLVRIEVKLLGGRRSSLPGWGDCGDTLWGILDSPVAPLRPVAPLELPWSKWS